MSFDAFVATLSAEAIEFEHLKVAQLAQAILESGRGSSNLFKQFKNPYGMKYRSEMAKFATSVPYTDAAGEADQYCAFPTYVKAVRGYWAFIDRPVYTGWRVASQSAEEYIRYITFAGYFGGPHDQVPPERREADRISKEAYVAKVKALFGEAESRLAAVAKPAVPSPKAVPAASWRAKGVYIDVGHGPKPKGYDPGAGNTGSPHNEHALNGIAAEACKKVLQDAGIPVRVDDHNATNFEAGKAAANYDVLVSIHHNSASSSVQGSLGLYHVTLGTAADKALAKLAADAMASELGIPNQGTRGQSLDVLRGGRTVGVRAAVLAELYFMHKQVPANPSPTVFVDWSTRGGQALGRAIIAWLQANP